MVNEFEKDKTYMYRGISHVTLMFVKNVDSEFVTHDEIEMYTRGRSPKFERLKTEINSLLIRNRSLSFGIMTREDGKQIIHEIFQ